MNHLAGYFGEKLGDMVEDAVKGALGVGDKDKEKDKDDGKSGFFSFFKRGDDDDEEEEKKKKKGGSSYGGGKDDDDGKIGFWDKLTGKEERHDGEEKVRGFEGMWREPPGMGGATGEGGPMGDSCPMGSGGGNGGVQSDLFNNGLDLANIDSTK